MTELHSGLMVTKAVRLVSPLGAGGMGSVWVADHLSLQTRVVVKFMSAALASSAEGKARFSREAAAAAQVKSPHVVHMLDHGVTDWGAPYIVMELLEGKDLAQRLLEQGTLPPGEVVQVVTQVAKVLSRAHAAGILHRDIKPENIFLCEQEGADVFAKLLDFGIAKAATDSAKENTTRTGSVIGTPSYMSPEQIIGAKVIDFRSDLWSLGVVAFTAFTGQKAFQGETVGALALEIHSALPVPSKVNPSLPPEVDDWFARACARDPAARFGSAKEMAAALHASIAGRGPMPSFVDVSSAHLRVASAEMPPDKSRSRSSTHEGASVPLPAPRDAHGPRTIALVAMAVTVAALGFIGVLAAARGRSPASGEPSGSRPAQASAPSALASPAALATEAPVPSAAPVAVAPTAAPAPSSGRSRPAPKTPGPSRKPPPSHKLDNDDIK